MKKREPIWDVLSKEQKQEALDTIIAFFLDALGESIGIIQAEQILDTVLEKTFPAIYNKGVTDAQKAVHERAADLNLDLDLLLRKDS